MQVIYIFADGTKSVVEVDQEVYDELKELDRQDYNANHKETRRHVSLDALDPDERYVAVNDPEYLKGLEYMELMERMIHAVCALGDDNSTMICEHFFEGKTLTEIAKEEGVSTPAIHKRLQKCVKKIAYILDDDG